FFAARRVRFPRKTLITAPLCSLARLAQGGAVYWALRDFSPNRSKDHVKVPSETASTGEHKWCCILVPLVNRSGAAFLVTVVTEWRQQVRSRSPRVSLIKVSNIRR